MIVTVRKIKHAGFKLREEDNGDQTTQKRVKTKRKREKSGRVQKRTVEKEETKTNDNILARILGPRKRNASIDCGKMLQIRVRELMQLTINLCTTERNQQPQMKMRKHQNKKQMRHY